MTVDGAQLAPEGSGVGSRGLGPGGAGLNDEALVTAQAVVVGVRVGIVLGQPGVVDLVLELVEIRRGRRVEGGAPGEVRFRLGRNLNI